MASQPANSTIAVHRRVRAYRQDLRHNTIKDLTMRMRPLIMSVPGEEVLVSQTLDAVITDAFRYGHPVVRLLREVTTFEEAAEGISGLEFPIEVGRDKFLNKDAAHVREDLHQDLRDVK